jgi:hypothetical protein
MISSGMKIWMGYNVEIIRETDLLRPIGLLRLKKVESPGV